jgi:chaperonin cofactor prefoldin
MNPEYQRLRDQADQLFHRFNDVVDDKGATGTLLGNIRNVVEEFEASKNPHSIEDRVKNIIEELKEFRSEGNQAMETGHAEELIADYEKLREQIRDLSNY